MRTFEHHRLCGLCAALYALPLFAGITTLRIPEGGIQPQVAVDDRGIAHVIYFSGDPSAGDLYYVRSGDGTTFSKPILVNTPTGRAVAMGNIRGAQMALGRGGRVHVAWMGGKGTGQPQRTPMLYTRLNDAGTAFEPERSVIRKAYGLDGGGSVAADPAGNVYVLWHAPGAQSEGPDHGGEANRRVWVARSSDDGKTFETEHPAWSEPTGACGCCGMRAYAARNGDLYVLYRSAREIVNRDMYLLRSTDHGKTFSGRNVHQWKVGQCVMSSETFAENGRSVFASWETEEQVYFAPVTGGKAEVLTAGTGTKTGRRKYPAVAANAKGETLLAWTEGMAWKKGGALAWQVFDASGKAVGEPGRLDGVPAWSLVAAFARKDGEFVVVY